MKKSVDLFATIGAETKLHQQFVQLRNSPGHRGCLRLMNEVFNEMENPDENFIEQFQTQGFEARVFELGLFAALKECFGSVQQPHEGAPDFLVTSDNGLICLEATTSNAPDNIKLLNLSGDPDNILKKKIDESTFTDELPIRLGSPLYSKLKKKYWDLPQCKEKSLIFAIQVCHEAYASQYPFMVLLPYLFGTRSYETTDVHGKSTYVHEEIESHNFNEKTIPSHFFAQPDSEFVSGVLFSNQLTVSKFTRMAFLKGYQRKGLYIQRSGTCLWNNSIMPNSFSYTVGAKNTPLETWSQGLSLILNPSAKHPVNHSAFLDDVALSYQKEGRLQCKFPKFFPLNSNSFVAVRDSK